MEINTIKENNHGIAVANSKEIMIVIDNGFSISIGPYDYSSV